MKSEYKLLLELCKNDNEIFLNISKDELSNLNWLDILWQINLHRIGSYIAKKTINNLSLYAINKIVARDAAGKYLYNNARNAYIYNVAILEVINILNALSIDYGFTKGIICATSLYDDIAQRQFNDIDILINKKDLKKVKNELIRNGYVLGTYNFMKKEIESPNPEMIKFYEMTTHQTHSICKMSDDPVCDNICIDLNFGLGPDSNLKDSEFIESILERKEKYLYGTDIEINGLSKEDMLIHTCLHIYRDSSSIFHIKNYNDSKLYQYIDLYKIITHWKVDWNYIISISKKYNFDKQLYYSLYFCGEIFNDAKTLIKDCIRDIEIDDRGYLDCYGFENNEQGKWNVPFIERLFQNDRYNLIRMDIENNNFNAFKNREKFMERYQ